MMSYRFLVHGGEEKAADESEQGDNNEAGGSKAHCRGGCKKDFRQDLIFLLDLDRDESNCLRYKLLKRDANRSILVRRCKPVFELLCDAEELLHLLRSWRCGRSVRIEWPCELAEEVVEFLLAHGN
jgi:hypothetical protein